MLEGDLVLLALVDELGVLKGKTRFHKLTFLLLSESKRLSKLRKALPFEIYHYGPFSFDLENAIDELVERRLLKMGSTLTSDGNVMFHYRLTPEARKLLRDARSHGMLKTQTERDVERIASRYGYLPLDALIKQAYATFDKGEKA